MSFDQLGPCYLGMCAPVHRTHHFHVVPQALPTPPPFMGWWATLGNSMMMPTTTTTMLFEHCKVDIPQYFIAPCMPLLFPQKLIVVILKLTRFYFNTMCMRTREDQGLYKVTRRGEREKRRRKEGKTEGILYLFLLGLYQSSFQ